MATTKYVIVAGTDSLQLEKGGKVYQRGDEVALTDAQYFSLRQAGIHLAKPDSLKPLKADEVDDPFLLADEGAMAAIKAAENKPAQVPPPPLDPPPAPPATR